MKPLVSAVITTYNQAAYIGPAIRSALDQRYENLEVIVVDDGSVDDTPSVIASFGTRIGAIRQANRGIPASRNTGIRHAQGDFVAFLDGDDLWEPDKVAVQVAAALTCPRSGAIVADGVVFTDDRIIAPSILEDAAPQLFRPTDAPLLTLACYEPLVYGNFIVTTSQVMVPRAVLGQIGLSDESLPLASDYDLYLRIAAHYEITFVRERLTRWRYSRTSASGPASLKHFRFAVDFFRIWQKQLRGPSNPHAWLLEAHIRATAYRLAQAAYYQGRRGERVAATRFLLRLLRHGRSPGPAVAFLAGLWSPAAVASVVGPWVRRALRLLRP